MCCLSKQKLGWDLLNCSKQEVILLSPSSMYHKRRRRIFGFFQVTKTQYKNTGTATSIPIYLFRMFQSERREHRNAHKPRRQKTRQHCYGESSFVIYEQISVFSKLYLYGIRPFTCVETPINRKQALNIFHMSTSLLPLQSRQWLGTTH